MISDAWLLNVTARSEKIAGKNDIGSICAFPETENHNISTIAKDNFYGGFKYEVQR
jgi:hypothetical protein